MATAEQALAAAANAEKAGDMAAAEKLRAYAKSIPAPVVHSFDSVTSAARKARAAGDIAAADKLDAYAKTLPQPKGAITPDNPEWSGVVPPPRADDPAYSQATPPRENVFGDTTAAMVEGPWQATKAFGGGLVGGPSPSRDFFAQDPLTKGLPGPVLTGLGAVGDTAMTGLSAVGAGISGLTGLAAEAVPGLSRQSEGKLAGDLLDMSMFAVPELAGGSSVAGMAAKAPKIVRQASSLSDDVSAAQRLGIPVMRTDVTPPKTAIGKIAQRAGEGIPIAGTGGMRAEQNAARITAAQDLIRQYGADALVPAIDDVAASVLAKRNADLTRLTGQKSAVINGLSGKGAVPVPKAVAAIDAQIAKLTAQKMDALKPVIAKLEDFKASLSGQGLTEIEANRRVIGEAFSGLDMGAIRSTGEKALSAVYGPLREDMGNFIKSAGKPNDFGKWKAANDQLAAMAGELSDTAFKRVMTKGEASPEVVRSMLFSAKPSDVARLYKNLTPEGQAAARTAILQEALSKAGDLATISPEKLKSALHKMGSQIGVFFKGDDLEAVTGLQRALKLTERASVAGAAPLTGVQNMPAIALGAIGAFTGSITGTTAIVGGLGGLARLYESTGVQSALRALSKAAGPKAEAMRLQRLDSALRKSGLPAIASEAANSAAQPDYDSLYGRY